MGFIGKIFSVVQTVFNYTLAGLLLKWLAPKTPDQKPSDFQAPPLAKQGEHLVTFYGRFNTSKAIVCDIGDVKVNAVKAKGGKK